MMQWIYFPAVSKMLKTGSEHLNLPSSDWWEGLPRPLQNLWSRLGQDEQLEKALENEARTRMVQTLQGILRYQQSDVTRDVSEPEVLAQIDQVKLLYYPAKKPIAHVCFIPSLINRYYILDLSSRLSFVRYLNEQGISASIVDWDEPQATQTSFRSEEYIETYVFPFLKILRKEIKAPLVLTGYCMGGLLALAAVTMQPRSVDALGLLATPWDFHVPEFPKAAMAEDHQSVMASWIDQSGMLPADFIQMLFYASNPWLFHSKFQQFAEISDSKSADDFVLIEQWVNDGVPMTAGLAHESFLDWVQCNKTMKGEWEVCGKMVQPQKIRIPTFIAAPQDDRIVPLTCALPLAKIIPQNTLIQPYAGHVSMVVGSRRRQSLWNPFAAWLKQLYN
jgi:polyhydroxyalkanoate synthase